MNDPAQLQRLSDRSLCHRTAGLAVTARRIAADALTPMPLTPLIRLHQRTGIAGNEPGGLLDGRAGSDLATRADNDLVQQLLTERVTWSSGIYEPETHAFGGPDAMTVAHALFHKDGGHLLDYLHHYPTDRREQSLVLCTALMRAAGLDLDEQGTYGLGSTKTVPTSSHRARTPAPGQRSPGKFGTS